MRIAITGEKGFLGIHLTSYFRNILKYEVIELGRNYLDKLPTVKNIDWLIHGACIHRNPDPVTLLELNRKLTTDTLNCLKDNGIECNIAFLSSYHEELETPYGQSKREAKISLKDYCSSIGKEFVSFKLHNIFGKYAVPNRTSFIATFCYNLHNNLPVNFNANEIKLVNVDEVLPVITSFTESKIEYTETTVENVYYLLKYFHDIYLKNTFPLIKTKFELDLYQTYLSYKNYKL